MIRKNAFGCFGCFALSKLVFFKQYLVKNWLKKSLFHIKQKQFLIFILRQKRHLTESVPKFYLVRSRLIV